jgi:hypothetical protein
MHVNEPAKYSEPDEDEASNEALLHGVACYTSTLHHAHRTEKAVLFCPLPGHVRHLNWRLRKLFRDHLDICYMNAEMGNNEHKEMQL